MQKISITDIGQKMASLISNKDLVEEDIGILNDKGELVGVFISKEAYEFFLKKVEEAEDAIDTESVKDFNESGEKG